MSDHGAAVGGTAQDLLARANRHNQIIIEDGYDSQLLDEAPQQALKSLDRSGRRRLCRLDVEDLARACDLATSSPPPGSSPNSGRCAVSCCAIRPNNQRAVALFLSLGHHEALVRRLSSAFDERRKRLVHAISAFLPEWHSTDSAGGTSLWLEGRGNGCARGWQRLPPRAVSS